MTKSIITPGERHGMLVILSEATPGKNWQTRVNCVCDCGNTTEKQLNLLRNGNTKSCGCLWLKTIKKSNTKHNMRLSPEYNIWNHIKHRCTNKNVSNYHRYGGRGITMSPLWLNSFEQFYKDMGPRPSHLHSADRINNDGNYEPSNCKWSTVQQQNNNKSSCIMINYNGKNLNLTQWSRETGISRHILDYRRKKGLPPELILHTAGSLS